eukprot:1158243-Pelagomonas_calceolata.AAC.9
MSLDMLRDMMESLLMQVGRCGRARSKGVSTQCESSTRGHVYRHAAHYDRDIADTGRGWGH